MKLAGGIFELKFPKWFKKANDADVFLLPVNPYTHSTKLGVLLPSGIKPTNGAKYVIDKRGIVISCFAKFNISNDKSIASFLSLTSLGKL